MFEVYADSLRFLLFLGLFLFSCVLVVNYALLNPSKAKLKASLLALFVSGLFLLSNIFPPN